MTSAVVVVGVESQLSTGRRGAGIQAAMQKWDRCKGVVVLGRTESGGRAGLVAPRECRRIALDGGDYCEVHEQQRDVQDL